MLDLRNSFKTLGNTRKGLSAKERSWNIAEAILSSLSDTQRKSLVNNLGKEYGVTDFDFMLDARNKGNASQINSLYNSSPLRKSASVISYSEWLNKNKVIDSMDNSNLERSKTDDLKVKIKKYGVKASNRLKTIGKKLSELNEEELKLLLEELDSER